MLSSRAILKPCQIESSKRTVSPLMALTDEEIRVSSTMAGNRPRIRLVAPRRSGPIHRVQFVSFTSRVGSLTVPKKGRIAAIPAAATPAIFAKTARKIMIEEAVSRSEEHTSELQSRGHLVCRLLLEK